MASTGLGNRESKHAEALQADLSQSDAGSGTLSATAVNQDSVHMTCEKISTEPSIGIGESSS